MLPVPADDSCSPECRDSRLEIRLTRSASHSAWTDERQPPAQDEEFPSKPVFDRTVDLDKLRLDKALEAVPTPFLIQKLQSLGQELLYIISISEVRPFLPANQTSKSGTRTQLPVQYLPCQTARNRSLDGEQQPLPTHILSVNFGKGANPMLLPIHGLCWAFVSPLFDFASRSPPDVREVCSQPGEDDSHVLITRYLPCFSIHLPSPTAFHILHQWIHLRSPFALLQHFLSSSRSVSPPTSPSQIPQFLLQQSTSHTNKMEGYQSQCSPKPSWSPIPDSELLRRRKQLLVNLRELVCSLLISDDELWDAMKLAWEKLSMGIKYSMDRENGGG